MKMWMWMILGGVGTAVTGLIVASRAVAATGSVTWGALSTQMVAQQVTFPGLNFTPAPSSGVSLIWPTPTTMNWVITNPAGGAPNTGSTDGTEDAMTRMRVAYVAAGGMV